MIARFQCMQDVGSTYRCTAVTAVLLGQRLMVANVGDSRAVLCRRGQGPDFFPLLACSEWHTNFEFTFEQDCKLMFEQYCNSPQSKMAAAAMPMTTDHKPNSKEERQRIEKAGGVVVWAGTWRVAGVLAVSRAFGDRPLKQYVIPTPDIQDEWLSHDDEFLILASDGLWDVVSNQACHPPTLALHWISAHRVFMSPATMPLASWHPSHCVLPCCRAVQDAVHLVKDIQSAEAAAKRLTEEAYQRGSNDNISCIVVRFKF
jgi:protein phosphatase 1L